MAPAAIWEEEAAPARAPTLLERFCSAEALEPPERCESPISAVLGGKRRARAGLASRESLAALRSGVFEATAGLESPERCSSPSDTLKALWLSERKRTSTAAASCEEAWMATRGSVFDHFTDPWSSDDSPAYERPQSASLPEPLVPTVSLSPQHPTGWPARSKAAQRSADGDGAAPSVRWSCPALVVRRHVADEVLVAGGFSSELPSKRLREQAFDASALLRVSM